MKIEEIPVTIPLPPPRQARSKGIHVSSIIRAIALETGILKRGVAEEISLVDFREITDPQVILRMSIGLAWEEWYIPQVLAHRGITDHPGEWCLDGIYMSPDAEGEEMITVLTIKGRPIYEVVPVVHEIKSTYKSARRSIEDEWLWMSQIKAYCKAKGTRFAHIHVLFICGDYSRSGPITPILKEFALEFTQEELDLNWALITEYKESRIGNAANSEEN